MKPSFLLEAEAAVLVAEALEPLDPDGRARVLMMFTTSPDVGIPKEPPPDFETKALVPVPKDSKPQPLEEEVDVPVEMLEEAEGASELEPEEEEDDEEVERKYEEHVTLLVDQVATALVTMGNHYVDSKKAAEAAVSRLGLEASKGDLIRCAKSIVPERAQPKRPKGVTPSAATKKNLELLVGVIRRNGPQSTSEIGARMSSLSSTTQYRVKKAEELGLIVKQDDGKWRLPDGASE